MAQLAVSVLNQLQTESVMSANCQILTEPDALAVEGKGSRPVFCLGVKHTCAPYRPS